MILIPLVFLIIASNQYIYNQLADHTPIVDIDYVFSNTSETFRE